ncbi:hypothetical protein [Pseudoxanthomonas winnipegensis]|uniref:hypothetical protein n=1 Tax=Pseudoxanthomonas winnipegensis TaxID=2480810 RepID=UPI00103BE45C|nr:hypothetical protein [Pseudoxanthomonas winnipegensis]TBV73262.1 hypothetical protein EYC45_12830 [Pseudoxanthomonas winnipegensis]
MKRYHSWCLVVLLFAAAPASALQMITGKVKEIEVSYMPGQVRFTLTEGNATCPAGKQLIWTNSNAENNKAVYAALAAALSSGKAVRFYFDDGDESCIGKFFYMVDV